MPRKPTAPRPTPPDLSPDQLDLARNLYLRRGATPKWVAEVLGVTWRSVQSAAIGLGWVREREERDDLRKRRAKPDAIAQVALEAEQDERHAALARRELELREALVEKAQAALVDMSPKDALRALGRFSGLKDLQFVERLARGRATDKIEADAAENLRALSEQMLEALTRKAVEAQVPPAEGPAPPAAPAPPAGAGKGRDGG